jgi:argonaute-like protein implicated in RNA metabolism and viral defense
MQLGIPTQLILETTLSGERSTQPIGTLAWNLSVALYYKAGGFPWRLSTMHENTCFVGVTFYHEKDWDPATMGTSVAQIFDRTGEGLIIKGGKVEWQARGTRAPHLSKETAAELAERVLEAYKLRSHHLPNRIVFHKSSRFWSDEIEGFQETLAGIKVDYIAIEQGNLRLVREGDYPPLRGTCLALTNTEYIIYGIGYIPYLNTYPGHHVPSPLHVLEHRGETIPQQACNEILALTKLNWNTAQYCCGVPMTLNIARRVSAVLAELPEGTTVEPSYRFYM